MKLSKYKSIIFDCDGVILNSNSVKTQAFYLIAKSFGDEIADSFIEYHKKKWWYFKVFENKISCRRVNAKILFR